MNAHGGGHSRSRSVAIVTNFPETESLRCLLEELLTKRRLALLRLENTGELSVALLISALGYSASSKWTPPTNYCTAIAMSERIALVLWLVVVCTQPQILDIAWCFNQATRLQLLSPLFVSMDTTKHGLTLQAMEFTGVYETFTSVCGK